MHEAILYTRLSWIFPICSTFITQNKKNLFNIADFRRLGGTAQGFPQEVPIWQSVGRKLSFSVQICKQRNPCSSPVPGKQHVQSVPNITILIGWRMHTGKVFKEGQKCMPTGEHTHILLNSTDVSSGKGLFKNHNSVPWALLIVLSKHKKTPMI